MIRARNLTKRYGDAMVLNGVSFEVAMGERIGILGTNGAGKTTLFRCLLGLTGFEGSLELDGTPARPESLEVRERIGYVPQHPPMFDLTLGELFDLVAGVRGIRVERAISRLDDLGLSFRTCVRKPLRSLSGGMLQKAYLALALAAEPSVLLLDEPTASLDPGSRRDFVRLLSNTPPETTLVLASHRLEEIEPLTRRILVLREGAIAFDGTLSDLWKLNAVPGPERSVTLADTWRMVAP